MKRPNITPGDWRQNTVAVKHDIHDVLSDDGATVAFIPGKGIRREADGKAIASVPKLLAALESCLLRLDHHDAQSAPECLQARAALIEAGYTFD